MAKNETDQFLEDDVTKKPQQPPAAPLEPPKPPAAKKAPDKPHVRKAFSRFGSSTVPASLPVSTGMCPPITKRKHAIYQLLAYKDEKGKQATDGRITDGDNRIEPQIYELVPAYTIYDRFEIDIANRDKIIQFIDGTEQYSWDNPSTGKKEPRVRPKVIMPFFVNGQRIVDIEAKYMQYLWWELHPRNGSNKYHDKTKKPIFRRVDLDHVNPTTELVKRQLKTQAHNRIDKIRDNKELVSLASALNILTGLPPTDMRIEIHNRIERDPESVLYAEGDPTATTRLNIHKAMDLGVIDFMPDLQQFFFSTETTKAFHTVLDGKDPVEDLANFFNSEEGADAYQNLVETVEYWK